jgi:hypothetical protein
MSSSSIYLSSLNTAETVGTAATIDITNSPLPPSYDLDINYGVPLNIVQNIFKFCTTDLSGNYSSTADEQITIKVDGNSDNFISESDGGNAIYNNTKDNGTPLFINYEANDSNADAGHQFLRYVSLAVFGTPLGVEFFSNEGAMLLEYGLAINRVCESINNYFKTPSVDTSLIELDQINNQSARNLRAGKTLIQYLISFKGPRFGLGYNFTNTDDNNTVVNASSCQVNGGSGSGGATVDVDVNDSDINITMNNTGSGYLAGDLVTIEGGSYTLQATINSVQAAMLNGTLNDSTNLTSYPFEPGDEFVILLTLLGSAAQKNVFGNVVDVVIQNVKLVMKVNNAV